MIFIYIFCLFCVYISKEIQIINCLLNHLRQKFLFKLDEKKKKLFKKLATASQTPR
jgi:hypothetical protein